MRTQRFTTFGIMTLSLIAVIEVSAQTAEEPGNNGTAPSVTAEDFEQRAAALHEVPGRSIEAARLYRKAGFLRGEKDAEAVRSYEMSAHLFGYANQPTEAKRAMEKAALLALANGDVPRAAQAYIDAAFFAGQENRRGEVNRLGKKALQLSSSSLLTESQRAAITGRIKSSPALASVLK